MISAGEQRIAPTPRDACLSDGSATLYRFRRSQAASGAFPLLVVPSMINRWYVVDLRPGVSLVRSLVDAGIDTWCLDWGVPRDEDRHLSWDDVLARLHRMARRVLRETGAPKVGILGYCMGGTLSAIHAALHPDEVAALVDLAGPIDFSEAGALGHMVDRRWFDADAIADAGNVAPEQMQTGFVMLRPTQQIGKWVTLMHRVHKPGMREAFTALETWANDNVAFPAEAYRRYIGELYQQNQLVRGEHCVGGQPVDLGRIRCPVLVVAAERDTICPPRSASALVDHVGTDDSEVLVVPGGHVGAVVGSRAPTQLYPKMADWLVSRLRRSGLAA